MKNKKWIFILFAAYTVEMSLSCTKDKLTKATQIGANTFSCIVDGKVLISPEYGGLFGAKPVFVSNLPIDGFTLIGKSPTNSNSFDTYILIKLPSLKTIGTYSLNTYPYGLYKIDYGGGPAYHTNADHTGTLNITRCDTVNRIYSGTFSFTAIDDSTGKTVKIADGRFDVKQ